MSAKAVGQDSLHAGQTDFRDPRSRRPPARHDLRGLAIHFDYVGTHPPALKSADPRPVAPCARRHRPQGGCTVAASARTTHAGGIPARENFDAAENRRSFSAADLLLRAAYDVTASLPSHLPRSLASDRDAGSKSRAALPSSFRRLRAVLAQVDNNEHALPCATVPCRIVQASQDAAQMTARPCQMGVPVPLSRQVPWPAARPQRAASGRRVPGRRD